MGNSQLGSGTSIVVRRALASVALVVTTSCGARSLYLEDAADVSANDATLVDVPSDDAPLAAGALRGIQLNEAQYLRPPDAILRAHKSRISWEY